MSGPDLTQYIELPLVDKDPQDIFDNARINAQSNFPEWRMREGNQEVVLMELLAEEVAESVFAINRLPSVITEVLLKMFGVDRDIGAQPTVDLRFLMSGTTGYTIPIGTNLVLDLGDGYEPITFSTDEELTIPAGQSYGIVSATGDRYTEDANGTPADTILLAEDMLIYVDYVKIESTVKGGRDPEEDIDYLSRGMQRFQRLSTTLVLPSHFTAAALEFDFIERATTLDNYNPANDLDNNGPIGNDVGYVTIAVYGDNELVSTEDKATLQAFLEANSMAALTTKIIDPTFNTINITAAVRFDQGSDVAQVTANIVSALSEYLDPQNWPWDGVVRRNDLISLVTNITGVDFVSSMTLPAADITLTGVAPLTKVGTIAISAI